MKKNVSLTERTSGQAALELAATYVGRYALTQSEPSSDGMKLDIYRMKFNMCVK
jgi:hypothetical protein